MLFDLVNVEGGSKEGMVLYFSHFHQRNEWSNSHLDDPVVPRKKKKKSGTGREESKGREKHGRYVTT